MSLNDMRTHGTRRYVGARPPRAVAIAIDAGYWERGMRVVQGEGLKWLTLLLLGLLLVLGMLFALDARAEEAGRQDFGSGGVFSYVPPSGWKVAEFPGLKFKISHGAPANGFAPNIVVVDEAYNESLDNYAKDNATELKKLYPSLKDLGQSDFKTEDGARVIKLITERDDDSAKRRLRQVFYFYDAGDKKLVATCSGLAEGAPASDLVCDATMKTFSVKPVSN